MVDNNIKIMTKIGLVITIGSKIKTKSIGKTIEGMMTSPHLETRHKAGFDNSKIKILIGSAPNRVSRLIFPFMIDLDTPRSI